jgi:hypothetical protein
VELEPRSRAPRWRPDSIVGTVEATLASIDTTRVQVEQRNALVLSLQDAVSRAIESCDEASARIEDARRQAVARVFVQHELPIWRIRSRVDNAGRPAGTPARLSDELGFRIDSLRIYLQAYWRGVMLTLVLFLVLSLVLYRARGRVARDTEEGVALPQSVADVLRAPLSAALLLTIFVSRPLRPEPPLALAQVVLLIAFPAALVVLRPLTDPRLLPAFFALGLLLVIDVGRGLLQAAPVLEQVVLILEMSAGAALLCWVAARLPTSTGRFRGGCRGCGLRSATCFVPLPWLPGRRRSPPRSAISSSRTWSVAEVSPSSM